MMTEEMITEGIDTDLLVEGVEELVERAKEDYRKWSEMSSRYDGDSESRRTIRDDMIAEFNSNLHYYAGMKYIKIWSKNTIWGFVVLVLMLRSFDLEIF